MKLQHAIALATLAAILLATGCRSPREEKQSDLPSIAFDDTPFIRITELAYMDLLRAAIDKKTTPTQLVIESEIKRQRVFTTETLHKDAEYIPGLIDHKDRKSILTIDSGVEEWALVETAIWDEQKKKAVVTAGFIPAYEYKNYLSDLAKAEQNNDK
jgi:hypothetical protein